MNKAELVAALAESMNTTKKDAECFLKSFEEVVTDELKKGVKVPLVGLGTSQVSPRPSRSGINPRTKETIEISAAKTPKFKAGKALKDAVNEK